MICSSAAFCLFFFFVSSVLRRFCIEKQSFAFLFVGFVSLKSVGSIKLLFVFSKLFLVTPRFKKFDHISVVNRPV